MTFIFINSSAQKEEFELTNTTQIEREIELNDLDVRIQKEYKDLKLIVGFSDFNEGLKLHILNRNDSIIYVSKGQQESYYFAPYIFQSNTNKDCFIIVGEVGTEYSWGTQLYYVENEKIQHIGHLNIAIYEEIEDEQGNKYGQPSRIYQDLKISREQDLIVFEFNSNKLAVLYPGKYNEREIQANKVSFTWDNGILKKIINE